MNTSLNAHYTIAPDFEKRAKGLEFPLEVWAVAAALSHAETYDAIALATGLSDRKVQDAIHQLESKQLAVPQLMTWQEFNSTRKAFQAGTGPAAAPAVRPKLITTPDDVQPPIPALPDLDSRIKTVIAVPTAAPAIAAAAPASVSEPVAAPADAAVSYRLGSITPTVSSSVGNPSWLNKNAATNGAKTPAAVTSSSLSLGSMSSIQARSTTTATKISSPATVASNGSTTRVGNTAQKPLGKVKNSFATAAPVIKVIAAPAAQEASQFKLRPMLAQIEKLCGGGIEGDLLVYQVFLRVPLDLLREEGISSLNIVDDQTVFSSTKLHAAIVRATKEVTGFNLQPALAS
jgi:hypothetical protein